MFQKSDQNTHAYKPGTEVHTYKHQGRCIYLPVMTPVKAILAFSRDGHVAETSRLIHLALVVIKTLLHEAGLNKENSKQEINQPKVS